MRKGPEKPKNAVSRMLPVLASAVVAPLAWAAWLGWDQRPDVQTDGTTTGPYQAWQILGLVLTQLAPVYWATARRHPLAAVLGTSAGLTAAAYYDWSDDSSGLFAIGVGLVALGSLAATAAAAGTIAFARRMLTGGGRPPAVRHLS
ncbi:hypothetical protein ABZ760_15470 [Streptomyces sp. NPDC006658]|uniref:hypothetical protein n=1 Tax=Streptomyces sp. NPDC006658 TaxID=3156900 RepID=UPI0033CFF8CF